MENSRIANIFEEIADLLDLKDANQYRVRSYHNAAQTLRGLSDSVEQMISAGEDVSDLPNIGEASADKIHEILRRGTCRRLEDLRKELPAGLGQLLQVPDLGPKKAMQLYKELDITSLDELESACEQKKVRKLDGMGVKTEENILKGIATVRRTEGRFNIASAAEQLESLEKELEAMEDVQRYQVAGSFRRGCETVGDLDILIAADDRKAATEKILNIAEIDDVLNKGSEKVSVRLTNGMQVDFRFFEKQNFGAALMYFTGSKAHNIQLRRRAGDRDWKLNEYGLFEGDNRLAGKTEKELYKCLELSWVPPELREDRGEMEAAANNQLPELVELDDIRGDFQCHTTASDGENSIREMAQAARARGWQFLAITDHSKRVTMANGLDDDACLRHADKIREENDNLDDFWLLAGIEVDILKDGSLDLKEKTLQQLDWVVGSIHYDRNQDRQTMTDRLVTAVETGLLHSLGHPLGRIIGRRDPVQVDFERLAEACKKNNVCLEINAQPDRLDLPDVYCQQARDMGVAFTLGTDAHAKTNFSSMCYGVTMARRGWLSKKDILNTLTAKQLQKKLKSK